MSLLSVQCARHVQLVFLSGCLCSVRGILAGLSMLSCLAFVWFTLVVNRTLPASRLQLFVSCIVGSLTINAGSGLYYEASAELCVRIVLLASLPILCVLL